MLTVEKKTFWRLETVAWSACATGGEIEREEK